MIENHKLQTCGSSDYTIGRFWQVDPLADKVGQESLTPYQYSFNNPILYNDPFGDCPPDDTECQENKKKAQEEARTAAKADYDRAEKVVDFLFGWMFTPETEPSDLEGDGEHTDGGGVQIVGGAGGPGASSTKNTAENADAEPIDGTMPSGTAGKFKGSSLDVANATQKASLIPGLSGPSSDGSGSSSSSDDGSDLQFVDPLLLDTARSTHFLNGNQHTFETVGDDTISYTYQMGAIMFKSKRYPKKKKP